jgi:release factor glutamine methyltransferase
MQPTASSPLKIRALIAEGEHTLALGPHPERARADSEALLLALFQRAAPERNRAWLLAHAEDPVDCKPRADFLALVARRLTGEPIQYILGETEFFGLPFAVTPDVLIPRPETEHLVEKALELARQFGASPRIADIGAGSGAIAVTLAHELAAAQLTAIDLSPAALDVARKNAARNGVLDRIHFFAGDLLAPVAEEKFEIIASNPPYVPSVDRPTLAVEVREFEPALALFAGEDGLDLYRRLIPVSFSALVSGGYLLLEIGFGQKEKIAALLAQTGFEKIEFLADLQQIPRVAVARRS